MSAGGIRISCVLALLLIACGDDDTGGTDAATDVPAVDAPGVDVPGVDAPGVDSGTPDAGAGVWRPFTAASPWNTPIDSRAPVHPESAALIAGLRDSATGMGIYINIPEFSSILPWMWKALGCPPLDWWWRAHSNATAHLSVTFRERSLYADGHPDARAAFGSGLLDPAEIFTRTDLFDAMRVLEWGELYDDMN